MEMAHHVRAIQADLASTASLGDEQVAEAARRLAEALEPSLRLRLLDLLQEAALGLSASLPDGHIEVRLAGRDPQLVYVPEVAGEPEPPAGAGDDLNARITLRLPDALKSALEAAADREGISTNAWVVRQLHRSLEPRARVTVQFGNRIQGFAQS